MELSAAIPLVPGMAEASAEVAEGAWIEMRYATYLERQQGRIDRLQRHRDVVLPEDLDISAIKTISTEGRQVIAKHKPRTLGEAASLSGVTQVDVETLHAAMQSRLKRGRTTSTNDADS
jgi:tRNA uridine 5-carboxymethylaminomethyl modification enzyme